MRPGRGGLSRWIGALCGKGHDAGCSARGGDDRGQDSRSTRPVSVSQGPFQTGLVLVPHVPYSQVTLCCLIVTLFHPLWPHLPDSNVTYGA